MDVPLAPRRTARRRRWLLGLVLASGVSGLALGARHWLQPAPPVVTRSELWTARVVEGPLAIHLHAVGVLRAEEVRWLVAESPGRVVAVPVVAGEAVQPDTTVLRMDNLELRLQSQQAQRDLLQLQAQELSLERSSQVEALSLDVRQARLEAQLEEAQARARAYRAGQQQFVSELEAAAAQGLVAQLRTEAEAAREEVALLERGAPEQRRVLAKQLQSQRRIAQLRQTMLDRLEVRAGVQGVLQEVVVEAGQWLSPGSIVGKVQVAQQLEAVLQVASERAATVRPGQAVSLQVAYAGAHGPELEGRVQRIAPAAKEGAVEVEVQLTVGDRSELRPAQAVEGRIETLRIAKTLSIARPVGLGTTAEVRLFRVDADGVARRVLVQLGQVSADRVEVRSGLTRADEVILSDLGDLARFERLLVR